MATQLMDSRCQMKLQEKRKGEMDPIRLSNHWHLLWNQSQMTEPITTYHGKIPSPVLTSNFPGKTIDEGCITLTFCSRFAKDWWDDKWNHLFNSQDVIIGTTSLNTAGLHGELLSAALLEFLYLFLITYILINLEFFCEVIKSCSTIYFRL